MSKLALAGGEKAVKLDYSEVGSQPLVSEKGIAAAVEQIRRGELSTSPVVGEFEEKFADYVGADYALASNNGTSSLHEALFAVGVAPGDEVIVPSFTFWATAAPILAAHGVPVFCDVDPDTHCLDPADIERKITPQTKAIMVVHVWGNPADMDSILTIAKDHDLAVIEDCSHAHGAEWDGKKVGVLGDVGCFSLQASKLLIAGEGGMLVTNNREYYERATALGHYERLSGLPEDSPYRKYSLTGLGYKYRVHPLGIAFASENLDELDDRNQIRDANGLYLEEGIADLEAVVPQTVLPKAERVFAYHYVRYEPEAMGGVPLEVFLKALKAEGVRCGPCGYGRLHEAPLFTEGDPYGRGCPAGCSHVVTDRSGEPLHLPQTEYLREQAFTMAPRFEQPNREIVDQYIAAYRKVVDHADQLLEIAGQEKESVDSKVSGRSLNLD